MRKTLASLGLVSLLVFPAWRAAAQPPAQAATATPVVIKACNLLSSKDIQSVQGEVLKQAVGRESAQGNLVESHCYFALPTGAKSISLSVTAAGKGRAAREIRAFLDEFHRPPKKKHRAPTKIEGLGQEAFWASSASGGNLYVFDRDRFIRLSVGGPGDQAEKLKKSKALARMVLARL